MGTDYTEQVEIIDYLSEKKFYNWAYDFGFALEPMFECIVPTILAGKLTDLVDSTKRDWQMYELLKFADKYVQSPDKMLDHIRLVI